MPLLEDIEDCLIDDMKANIEGIKTVDTHEKEFDEQTLGLLIPRAPFGLIRYVESRGVESEETSEGKEGVIKRSFVLALGASSMRSKKEGQRGCYSLLDQVRNRYDGCHLAVGDEEIVLYWDGDALIYSGKGIIVYAVVLSWNEFK